MLKVVELFSGYGSQRMSLERIGLEHEVLAIAEIDKFAIKSYEAIHGKTKNLGDVSLIDVSDVPKHDLLTYSFPCQDISLAGLQGGLDKNSNTRSSLLWECKRIIEHHKPKYLLMENVPNLVQGKHKKNFDLWCKKLEELGYTNYWKRLNSKNYGVPQNRLRVFMISILGEHSKFIFPKTKHLELKLKDILEKEVEEKYFLDNKKTFDLLVKNPIKENYIQWDVSGKGYNSQQDRAYFQDVLSPTLPNRNSGDKSQIILCDKKDVNRLLGIFDIENKKRQAGGVYDINNLSPTLDTMQGGWRQPSILIKNATKQGYLETTEGDGIDLTYPNSETRRGRVQKEMSQNLQTGSSVGILDGYRIRKLTPLECWRLMGVSDEDFHKAQSVNSNTQLYKQAGNSIVVNVLDEIFKELFKELL